MCLRFIYNQEFAARNGEWNREVESYSHTIGDLNSSPGGPCDRRDLDRKKSKNHDHNIKARCITNLDEIRGLPSPNSPPPVYLASECLHRSRRELMVVARYQRCPSTWASYVSNLNSFRRKRDHQISRTLFFHLITTSPRPRLRGCYWN